MLRENGGIDCRCICHQKDYPLPKDFPVPSSEKEWEGEFLDGFPEMNSDWSDHAKKNIPTENLAKQTLVNEGWNNARKYAAIHINSFLSSQIEKARTDLRKELEGKVKDKECEAPVGHPARFAFQEQWYVGYNQALSDILSIIKG